MATWPLRRNGMRTSPWQNPMLAAARLAALVCDPPLNQVLALAARRADFSSLKERLRRHGAELIVADRPTPFERFFFRDPNGYVFEVVAAERQPEPDAS